jgi:flavin-dependent dehydrogenase
MLKGDNRRLTLFNRMAERSGISHRYSIFEPEGEGDAAHFYRPGAFPGTGARMKLFENFAPRLATEAAERLLSGEDRSRITHLIVTCCTGFFAPLRDAAVAAGAMLFQPAEVAALSRQADRHILTLRRADAADEICARVVIAACGSWNTRGSFAVTAKSRQSDLFAFKAHFRGGALADGVMPLLAFPGGYGGIVHSDGGRVTLSCCVRRDALGRAREIHGGKAGEAVFRHILASTEGARRALQGATVENAILSTGPIRPGIRARYCDGIFFAGNVAGEAHPIIAEGISMAIQSSWLLVQRLVADGPAAGPNYARAWKRQFAARLYAASLFAWLAMNDHSRAAAAQLIRAFPTILTWGAALSGKTLGVRHDGT